MKYDLTQLLSQRINEIEVDTTFTFTKDDDLLKNEGFTVNPIEVSGSIMSDGRRMTLDVKYTSTWQYLCSRCLEETDYVVAGEIKRSIVKDGNDGDDGIVVVESTVIDLYDVIYNDIVLNLPGQVICDDECKGLCPDCGINLNSGDCKCSQEVIDPRLAKLKNLFTHD
jgi:uncharacterized protein